LFGGVNPKSKIVNPKLIDRCRFLTLRFIIGLDLADKEGKWTRKKNKEELKLINHPESWLIGNK
jgi:hypothetical protein